MKPIEHISGAFSRESEKINQWIKEMCERVRVPLYTSVDLRISNFKVAPVDTNLFPAGFNNLSDDCRAHTAQLFRAYFLKRYPRINRVLLIPELHTRNPYYWENLFILKSIIESVGYSVGVGLVGEGLREERVEFEKLSDGKLTAYKLKREGNRVATSEFEPDLLLINNDFSTKRPEILREIAQPVDPPIELGWHTRRKAVHFEFYNKLVREFAELIGIDPWLISMPTKAVSGVSLDDLKDREKVAEAVDALLESTRIQYERHGIKERPYAVIKSNAGTYGMAVITVQDPEEVRDLNLEGRKRMRVSKGGVPVRDVVVQEGVPTALTSDSGRPAEPVAYLVEANVAGAFLRHNTDKSERENLNTRGMGFSSIPCIYDEDGRKHFPQAAQTISRIASVAAGYEIEKILREGGCKECAS